MELVPTPGVTLAEMALNATTVENQLITFAEEHYGEVNPELESLLLAIEQDIGKKADSYKFVVDKLGMSAELMDAKAKEFQKASTILWNAHERIKERIKEVMMITFKDEVKGNNWRWALSKITRRPKVENVDLLPEGFFEVISEKKPVAEKIKASFEKGEDVPGVIVSESRSLRCSVNKGN